jgi:hypothetical protein
VRRRNRNMTRKIWNPLQVQLWEDLNPKAQDDLIERMQEKFGRKGKDLQNKLDIEEFRRERENVRPSLRSNASEDVWEHLYMMEGLMLDDGWFRLVVQTKWGDLEILTGQRFEENWLSGYSKEVRKTKGMTKWPEGSLPRSNPWKDPFTIRAGIVKVRSGCDSDMVVQGSVRQIG